MIVIGAILPTEALCKKLADIGQDLGVEIHTCIGEFTAALNQARMLQEQYGIQAIIVRNPLAHTLRGRIDIPVISLDISRLDIIRAMRTISPEKRIGFFYVAEDNDKYEYSEEEIGSLAGRNIKMIRLRSNIPYHKTWARDTPECRDIMSCDALVTSTPSASWFFGRKGMQVEFIGVDNYQAREMILNAVDAVLAREREVINSKMLEHMLNTTRDGFIALTGDRVVLVNGNVCAITGLSKETLQGQSIQDVAEAHPFLREVVDIPRRGIVHNKGVDYSVIKENLPQSGDSKDEDADISQLVTIVNIPNMQKKEYKIRRALTERGFEAKWHFDDIISLNEQMKELKQKALRYAQSKSSILILGESGTGKEMFAQSIHNASPVSCGPFVAINCAALPENLLESELYGYEEGAFTGARKGGKAGLFEMAHMGTLFLDEIGEMPPVLQAKLLRSIQEHSICRLGGDHIIPIDIRLICATNRNLADEVQAGRFREDLYYRIDVLRLKIPPLRERTEDISPLTLELLSGMQRKTFLNPRFFGLLERYHWPGNVRQLEAFLERLSAVAEGTTVSEDEFLSIFSEITEHAPPTAEAEHQEPERLAVELGTLAEIERRAVLHAFRCCAGNVQHTAERLGLSRSTVWRKLKEYGVSG